MSKRLRINEKMLKAATPLERKLAKQVHLSFRLRLSVDEVIELMENANRVEAIELPPIPTNAVREGFTTGGEIVAAEV